MPRALIPWVLLGLGVLLGTVLASQNGLALRDAPTLAALWMVLLTEALPPVAAALTSAAGYGSLLRRTLKPGSSFSGSLSIASGLALLLVLWQAVAALGQLHLVGLLAVLAPGWVGLLLAWVPWLRANQNGRQPVAITPPGWSWVALGPLIGVMLTAVTCPPGTLWRVEAFGYDVITYHLQLPREWIALGRLQSLDHNVYSHLPSLMESAYAGLGLLKGSALGAVYAASLLHVACALLAGGVLIRAARSAGAKGVAPWAAVVLALPWVTITGTLAYNEMAVLLFGSAGAALLLDRQRGSAKRRLRQALLLGLLAGAATLAKLTAGLVVALPLGLALLLQPLWWRPIAKPSLGSSRWGIALASAGIAALVGVLVLSPYLVRNTLQTGNPVFPFAHSVLGSGHWTDAELRRWDHGHGPSDKAWAQRFEALWIQGPMHTGLGAMGGQPAAVTNTDIAALHREGGAPVGAVVLLTLSVLALTTRRTCRPACLLLGWLTLQAVFWLSMTHLQGRFLVPLILPGALLGVLGLSALRGLLLASSAKRFAPWPAPVFGTALALIWTVSTLTTLWNQTHRAPGSDGQVRQAPVAASIDALHRRSMIAERGLPPDAVLMLVGDVGRMLYEPTETVYATAFDRHPLEDLLALPAEDGRLEASEIQAITRSLRDAGVTHVRFGWAELARLDRTYGLSPSFQAEILSTLARAWPPVAQTRGATMHRLPRVDGPVSPTRRAPAARAPAPDPAPGPASEIGAYFTHFTKADKINP